VLASPTQGKVEIMTLKLYRVITFRYFQGFSIEYINRTSKVAQEGMRDRQLPPRYEASSPADAKRKVNLRKKFLAAELPSLMSHCPEMVELKRWG